MKKTIEELVKTIPGMSRSLGKERVDRLVKAIRESKSIRGKINHDMHCACNAEMPCINPLNVLSIFDGPGRSACKPTFMLIQELEEETETHEDSTSADPPESRKSKGKLVDEFLRHLHNTIGEPEGYTVGCDCQVCVDWRALDKMLNRG